MHATGLEWNLHWNFQHKLHSVEAQGEAVKMSIIFPLHRTSFAMTAQHAAKVESEASRLHHRP
jgi:hypothetical protein